MSDRSTLLDQAIRWLDDDSSLDDLLGDGGDVFPAQIAEGQHADDSVVEADPRVFVAVQKTVSNRDNLIEDGSYTIHVIVDATPGWVRRTGSIDELTSIMDRVGELLTEHRTGWQAMGDEGDTPISVSQATNRYMTVAQFGYRRRRVHAAHE